MSTKELEKIKVLSQVRDKRITQAAAAKKLVSFQPAHPVSNY